MKPKNVMLLGFINSAVDYLEKHMDDENSRIEDLRNSNLYGLRDELAGSLDVILGTKQSTLSTLLKAGNEAFDDFVGNQPDNIGLSERFDKALENRFSNTTTKLSKKELTNLLSLYDLDGYSNNSNDSFMNRIKENAYNANNPNNNSNDSLDNVFNDIVSHEKNNGYNGQNQYNNQNYKSNLNNNFDALVNELRKQMAREDELARNNNNFKNVNPNTNYNQYQQAQFNQTAQQFQAPYQGQVIQPQQTQYQANQLNQEQVQPSKVNALIDEYIDKQIAEEERLKEEQRKHNAEICDRVSKIYTYLDSKFIADIYSLKDDIAKNYPLDKKIIVLHRIKFKDVENLRQFVEIGLKHGYTINADENKMIVDIFKQFVNSDGKILNNIYEIANQACILSGTYEGYNVIEVFDDDEINNKEE